MTNIFGKTFICGRCGKEHSIFTKGIFYSEDALDELIKNLNAKEALQITVMFDVRTRDVLGRQVVSEIKRQTKHSVYEYLVEDSIVSSRAKRGDPTVTHSPVCDDITKDHIKKTIKDSHLIIAVGSGVINDLAKWVSFEKNILYYVFATAASMNGYASANVAAKIKGLKQLFKAEAPEYVFAIPSIIENAPRELTSAGIGDAIAKPVSSADWMLNHLLFDEYYCQYAVDIVSEQEKIYMANPKGIAGKDPKAIKALFFALCYSGVSMSIAGSSSPASGGEHLVSHTLDMIADRDGKEHDLHGRQVGIGTILSANLYKKILELDHIDWQALPENINYSFWGSLSEEVEKEYKKKLEKANLVLEKFKDDNEWQKIRSELKKIVRSPEQIKNCLELAGAAHKLEHIGIHDAKNFIITWLTSLEMRSRFTILDLVKMANVFEKVAGEVVEEWVV